MIKRKRKKQRVKRRKNTEKGGDKDIIYSDRY